MRRLLVLFIICNLTFILPINAQNYKSNKKLLQEKELELSKLEEDFSIDSMTITSLVYGLEREIKSIEIERDSMYNYLMEIKPKNNVFGIIKKDISITDREYNQDHFFDQGDTVQLVNHSRNTYTLLGDNEQLLTINTKYIKPLEGKKRTTSLIAQYQIRLEDYQKILNENPTQNWFQFDINRVQKEKEQYEKQYDKLVTDIKNLKKEIELLKNEILKVTTS